MLLVALTPTLIVRAQRRSRERRIQAELPVLLDLLATLTGAGLGFDTALERYLKAAESASPLVQEWRQFQRQIIAGQSRAAALRALDHQLVIQPMGGGRPRKEER